MGFSSGQAAQGAAMAMGPAGMAAYGANQSLGDPLSLGNGNIGEGGIQGMMKRAGLMSSYEAKAPDITKQDTLGRINTASGEAAAPIAQQQQLANALMQQTQGYGPNPAQIALNQQTNRNIAQGAGAVASQKGINPALASRQIQQNAAMQQQQSAGQGALMQAQQQMGAQQQAGGLLGQMRGQGLEHLGIEQNANAQQNNAVNTGSLGAQQINAHIQESSATNAAKLAGGVLNSVGSLAGAAVAAHGGKVSGNKVPVMVSPGEKIIEPDGDAYKVSGKAKVKGDSEKNDTVPKMLDGGTVVVPRSKASDEEKTKEFIMALKSKGGGKKASSGGANGYAAVLAAHRKLGERLAALEKKRA